jgi:hypothetical protein
MRTVVPVPPGTPFGLLTVIEETRDASGNRAMLCQCECGQRKTVALSNLRSGGTKACGALHGVAADAARLNPGEIPLYGKDAQGLVALVGEADYELVMQYRWHVFITPGNWRGSGPYARTKPSGSKGIFMHTLITGWPEVDHEDRNGLNNLRSNLREATHAQNAANRGKRSDAQSSAYKGVHRRGGKWRAMISSDGEKVYLGNFANELSAAYAYDLAARELFGEFACTNFGAEPLQAALDAWQAEPEAQQAAGEARGQAHAEVMSEWWKRQEPETHTCTACGGKYQTRSRRSLYCGSTCGQRARAQRRA